MLCLLRHNSSMPLTFKKRLNASRAEPTGQIFYRFSTYATNTQQWQFPCLLAAARLGKIHSPSSTFRGSPPLDCHRPPRLVPFIHPCTPLPCVLPTAGCRTPTTDTTLAPQAMHLRRRGDDGVSVGAGAPPPPSPRRPRRRRRAHAHGHGHGRYASDPPPK